MYTVVKYLGLALLIAASVKTAERLTFIADVISNPSLAADVPEITSGWN